MRAHIKWDRVMKVVLFCGGLGTRLRDFSIDTPKPLTPIGYRPILWHVMKYYAYFGHTDFILCLGYKADMIKRYFLEYEECLSNDFVLSKGGRQLDLYNRDIDDWRITFADTGLMSNIGQRLKAVEGRLADDEIFLANYSDGLTDFPLPELIDEFNSRQAIGMFLSVRPNFSGHFLKRDAEGRVLAIDDVFKADLRINGGFFVFSRKIFDYIRPGEELVEQPLQRLIDEGRLFAREYDGFWRCMDTFKDLQALETLLSNGNAPWALWERWPGAPLPLAAQ
jgi:glucose-1-phosphate cytidylyltransferase